ncbi:MAG TPA: four helix bundle protein [Vicinamibacterales bacterium]|jgi:four helix bundle protein
MKSHDIQERAFAFACSVITFCRRLSRADWITRRLLLQLLDASTSVGANLEEADAGQTKRDFIAKASVARKECGESRFWLRLVAFAEPGSRSIGSPLLEESHQLLKILTTIIKNAQSNPGRGETS